MKFSCWISTLLCAATVAAVPACSNRSTEPRPNVILISIDTLRRDHLGAYGYDRDVSPNLDRLAGFGVVFEQAITQAPWTLPSHAALLTSLPPSVLDLGDYAEPGRISERAVCLAEFLKENGYQTHATTAGGFVSPSFGFNQGFDTYGVDGWDISYTVQAAQSFLENRDPNRPFFLFLHTYDVHSYKPPPELERMWAGDSDSPMIRRQKNRSKFLQGWDTRSRIARFTAEDWRYAANLYDATIYWVDSYLGLLLESLDRSGLFRNSLIVLTSDHGEELGDHGGSGHGYNLFDENLRVPLFIYHRDLKPGRVTEQVRLIDVAPTIADLLGLRAPPTSEGTSLRAVIDGSAPRLEALTENSHCSAIKSLRTARHKYILSTRLPHERLYDLENDPGEQDDIARQDVEATRGMRRLMSALLERNDANRAYRNTGAVTLTAEEREKLEGLGYVGGAERNRAQAEDAWLEVIRQLEAVDARWGGDPDRAGEAHVTRYSRRCTLGVRESWRPSGGRCSMVKFKKSWTEKLNEDKGLPQVAKIEGKMSRRWGEGTVVIPAPIEVDRIMRKVRKGKLITVNQIRGLLAEKHGATIGCPMTTGIFALIAARAAEEQAAAGKQRITPYWRTLKAGGEINPKFPGGAEAQQERLEAEGHTVVRKGKRLLVAEHEKRLATLRADQL